MLSFFGLRGRKLTLMVDDNEYVLLDVAIVARWRGLSQKQDLIEQPDDYNSMKDNRSLYTTRPAA